MSRLMHLACFLAFSTGVAHTLTGKRDGRETPNSHIVLTSRGQVEKLDESPKHKVGKDDTHKPHAKSGGHPSATFAQEVNGSTPTGFITLGTPPKKLFVIFDTGSDKLVAKTWDTVAAELKSVDQGVAADIQPSAAVYNHNSSSTYRRKYVLDPVTKKMVGDKQMISYGSGAAITDEGNDTIKIGHSSLQNFPISEITADSIALLHTKKGISGVLGLQHMKNRALGQSLFSRLRDSGDMTAFGYCRGTGDNGTFLWGDSSDEGHELKVIGQMHWAVTLGNLKVDEKLGKDWKPSSDGSASKKHGHHNGDGAHAKSEEGAKSEEAKSAPKKHAHHNGDGAHTKSEEGAKSEEAKSGEEAKSEDGQSFAETVPCSDHKCTGILDTGSNIIAGPSKVMKAIAKQAGVKNDCSNFDSLPIISLDFGGKAVTVHPEGYVMKVPMPSWAKIGAAGKTGKPFSAERGSGDGAAGLDQQDSRLTSQSGWKAVLEHLRKNRGIDLDHTIADWSLFENDKPQPEFLCMPALVPLDKHTAFGPLYIVGTPLLQTHYARWSYKANDDSPKIFIKPLSEAKVCKNAQPSPAASLEAIAPVAAPLLRSEQKLSSLQPEMPASRGPSLRDIEDISFPHWAKRIDNL